MMHLDHNPFFITAASMYNKLILILSALMVVVFLNSCGTAQKKRDTNETPNCRKTFTNPIMDGADPWVIKKDGFYYFCESRDGGIYVSKSKKLTEPQNWKRVWKQPDEGWNSSNLWAPELHYLRGHWYIYYAAGKTGPPFTEQRAGVLQGSSQDPQEAFIDKGQLYTGDSIEEHSNNIWAIDMTPLKLNGRLYAVWSGWKQNRDDDSTPQHLYIARMENPWTIGSNRVKISSPVKSWETGGPLDLNEGPEVLKNGKDVFIIYSTRESWLRYYRLGQLRLKNADADPMDPANWAKKGPVFRGREDIYGVGHASFTTSPDGSENWIVYHSKKSPESGWNRDVRVQPFRWKEDGSPEFGKPVQTGVLLPVPDGQCD